MLVGSVLVRAVGVSAHYRASQFPSAHGSCSAGMQSAAGAAPEAGDASGAILAAISCPPQPQRGARPASEPHCHPGSRTMLGWCWRMDPAWHDIAFGATGQVVGEVVFNTSMSGYQVGAWGGLGSRMIC
jgi:Carbamoyl-phosphate synthase small chain, CPSase domain